MPNLCMAGGVALNCVANGRLIREGPFQNIWIQPAAGDAGGALGAALSVWHRYLDEDRRVNEGHDAQQGSYLGPCYHSDDIRAFFEANGYVHHDLWPDERARIVAEQIAAGKIVGYMAGRMEFGPRALGARSILGDPRREEIQSIMNLKIKHRESFRPFAPSVLEEKASQYFDLKGKSPYMLLIAYVRKDKRYPQNPEALSMGILERLKMKRSDLPAVTHLDYSARIQTVNEQDKPDYYAVISEFEKLTGCPVVVNTSFNVRGEPIVCTYEDACKCFMSTDMDVLVIEDFILYKKEQPPRRNQRERPDDLILD